MGVAPLHEGNAAFQTMFCSGPQRVGNPVDWLIPVPSGPRHCGQFAVDADARSPKPAAQIPAAIIIHSSLVGVIRAYSEVPIIHMARFLSLSPFSINWQHHSANTAPQGRGRMMSADAPPDPTQNAGAPPVF